MKHLLYYDTTSAYTAEQWTAGGNGRKVVSVVDGVAWCEDSGDTYYRYAPPSQENLTSYTITIHYKTVEGETINPDTSIQTTCYIGKSTRECLFSKILRGFQSSGQRGFQPRNLQLYQVFLFRRFHKFPCGYIYPFCKKRNSHSQVPLLRSTYFRHK